MLQVLYLHVNSNNKTLSSLFVRLKSSYNPSSNFSVCVVFRLIITHWTNKAPSITKPLNVAKRGTHTPILIFILSHKDQLDLFPKYIFLQLYALSILNFPPKSFPLCLAVCGFGSVYDPECVFSLKHPRNRLSISCPPVSSSVSCELQLSSSSVSLKLEQHSGIYNSDKHMITGKKSPDTRWLSTSVHIIHYITLTLLMTLQ